jgi:quinol monooxygenase YgiN
MSTTMSRNLFLKWLLPAVTLMTANTMNAQDNKKNDQHLTAQQENRKFRIAKIEIYPAHLEEYKAALAEHARTAVRAEPGVLALQAVYDKAHPTQVTVFEVYASDSAYQAHLKTTHFLKYKNGTLKMVKSLELLEVEPIAMELSTHLARTP